MSGSESAPGSGSRKERESLRDLEGHVAAVLHRRVARNLNVVESQEPRSVGERMADRFARAAGSWRFVLAFFALLAVWMVINAVAGLKHWDPYPFILLNLVLSCVAAIQAPLILMSQNRQEARDRIRAEADYDVNVKAEVLLEHLTQEIQVLKQMLAQTQTTTQGQDDARKRMLE